MLVDNLDMGHTITGAYAYLLSQLQEKTKQVQCGKLTRGVLFQQDNAPTHSPVWQWLLSRNVDLNLSNIHHIPLIWLPLVPLPQNEKGARWSSFCHRL